MPDSQHPIQLVAPPAGQVHELGALLLGAGFAFRVSVWLGAVLAANPA
jgi:hypothetical protein